MLKRDVKSTKNWKSFQLAQWSVICFGERKKNVCYTLSMMRFWRSFSSLTTLNPKSSLFNGPSYIFFPCIIFQFVLKFRCDQYTSLAHQPFLFSFSFNRRNYIKSISTQLFLNRLLATQFIWKKKKPASIQQYVLHKVHQKSFKFIQRSIKSHKLLKRLNVAYRKNFFSLYVFF